MRKRTLQKIKLRKGDRLRALLTDTLPYEVPLLFSNEGFYHRLNKGISESLFADFGLNIFRTEKDSAATIPYTYKVKKSAVDFRSLSVMHPRYQKHFAEFYADYDSVVAALCQRSPYTLRAPVRVASHYAEKRRLRRESEIKGTDVEIDQTGFGLLTRTASSYFVYRRYGLIHKFYESTEFHALEKKFNLLLKLDVAQCFNHIYTHTISWAIKSKEFAKENKAQSMRSFDRDFDRLMQNSNYAETNGILIGPEVSRIFAELIFQRIDLDVQASLEAENLLEGRQYCIRRYVDDYFVFANDKHVLDSVSRALAIHLFEYKLHLNASKTTATQRPFVTGETIAKGAVGRTVSQFFDSYAKINKVEKENETAVPSSTPIPPADGTAPKKTRVCKIAYISNPSRVANTYIREIKEAVASGNVTFESISSYFFGTAKRRLEEVVKYLDLNVADVNSHERLNRILLVFLDLAFFVYAMCPRVRATYQISEIIILISTLLKNAPVEVRENVTKKIFDEATSVIESNYISQAQDNIELLNLLIALRSLGKEYLHSEEFLLALFCKELNQKPIRFSRNNFGYFQVVTLLHYIRKDAQYAELRKAIATFVHELFLIDNRWQEKAELTCLFFDFIRCPYIDVAEKHSLAALALSGYSDANRPLKARELTALVASHDWFFSWGEVNLADILRRKELRAAY